MDTSSSAPVGMCAAPSSATNSSYNTCTAIEMVESNSAATGAAPKCHSALPQNAPPCREETGQTHRLHGKPAARGHHIGTLHSNSLEPCEEGAYAQAQGDCQHQWTSCRKWSGDCSHETASAGSEHPAQPP